MRADSSGDPARPAKAGMPSDMDEDQALDRFAQSRISMVLTDATAEGNPIVYVNQAFEAMTGYTSAVALGQNCRFLQGEGSDPEAVRQMREAVAACREVSLDILNYRADGTAFTNRVMISPIVHDDECTHFVGLHMPVEGAGSPVPSVVLRPAFEGNPAPGEEPSVDGHRADPDPVPRGDGSRTVPGAGATGRGAAAPLRGDEQQRG